MGPKGKSGRKSDDFPSGGHRKKSIGEKKRKLDSFALRPCSREPGEGQRYLRQGEGLVVAQVRRDKSRMPDLRKTFKRSPLNRVKNVPLPMSQNTKNIAKTKNTSSTKRSHKKEVEARTKSLPSM